MKKNKLMVNQLYHVYTKSIAEFKIFNGVGECCRIIDLIRYYRLEKTLIKFSRFVNYDKLKQDNLLDNSSNEKLVEIIAYSIMPTHLHLILKQLKENGISIFMNNVLNSYTRYFNTKHNRKGPLWETRFKSILIESDEQLFHLTRYIHLNPVTAYLVNKPEDWQASSYKEYLSTIPDSEKICKYDDVLNIQPKTYKDFVEDNISYQRELARVKALSLE